jgi:DNA-binding response OmpR family regulator
MNKILLVEDSPETFTIVNQALKNTADLIWAKNISEAQELLETNHFELILLDIELPDGNGVELCTNICNQDPNQAIFLLTSHATLSDKVLGFSAGAEDYITKPFQMLEFKARVEAKLKKINNANRMTAITKWKELEIDKNKQKVCILVDENFIDIELTHIEFKLLTYLSDRVDLVIPRDEILNEIWGKDVYVYSRSVDTHVSKLRKKLGVAAEYIKSVHGTGYKFSEPN